MALNLAAKAEDAAIIFVNPFRKKELFEKVKVFTDVLGIETHQITNVKEYRETLKKIPKGTEVIVDTPGVSAQDMGLMMRINEILAAKENSEVFCCLDSTSSSFYNSSALSRLVKMAPDALVFTKLDETPVYGGIYSILSESNLPTVYYGIGSRIPDDFEEASKERIVSLILDI
jgi:flagellar biosynthesis protein FlhF